MGLLSWLWDEPAPTQLQNVERQEPSFEQRLQRIAKNSRGLSSRTEEERQELITDVTEALDILESAITILRASELADRGKKVRTRLRTIRTRAQQAAA